MCLTNFESNSTELHKKRKFMYETAAAYRRNFLNKKTGMILENLTSYRMCPLCGENVPKTIFNKNGGVYVKCQNCDMIYLNPVLKDEALTAYYRNNNYLQALAHQEESDFYTKIYLSGLEKIGSFVEKGNVLDIGCSGGFFLNLARNDGWKTFGIELNKTEAMIANRMGHKIWDIPIEKLNPGIKFNCITLWDVFEHIKDGASYLLKIKSLLNENGIVFLQIPNVGSLAARLLHERCNMFDGIEHVNLYSPQTIRRFCEINQLKLLFMETVISELEVVMKYLDYEDPYFSEKLVGEGFQFLNQKLISKYCMGYKMQLVISP